MDTKALRQKILDLAIRGKLVPQIPGEESASVLLEKIRVEKQQMVKDGKLKTNSDIFCKKSPNSYCDVRYDAMQYVKRNWALSWDAKVFCGRALFECMVEFNL